MSEYALCRNADELKCPLRDNCLRYSTGKRKRGQKYVDGDYYAGDCFRFMRRETDQEIADRLAEERLEHIRDNTP